MGLAKKIRILLLEKDLSMKQLATALEISPQNLSNKFSRDNFTEHDLTQIADFLDCDLDIAFISRDTGERL